MRAEINEVESRKLAQKINETKSQFFERKNKIVQVLPRFKNRKIEISMIKQPGMREMELQLKIRIYRSHE